ncbi:11116_t:CDS:2 [Funneliformis caledonium]|uniref:11116_t:CDS:1 n=1 Tax=Funneliformis caledonium TaxID=1117310 RepID=A0A9N9D848_9GLOM|nr:11116_t:CDS:2 [Funneliformis caledonium]
MVELSGGYLTKDMPRYLKDHVKGYWGCRDLLNDIIINFKNGDYKILRHLRVWFFHIHGLEVQIWGMDLPVSKIYRMFLIGTFWFPISWENHHELVHALRVLQNLRRGLDDTLKVFEEFKRSHCRNTLLHFQFPVLKSYIGDAKSSPQKPTGKKSRIINPDCVIKISKFLEEKSIIHEIVHKCFPFLSYTNLNAWHRDVFKYTDSEVKCPVCKEVHTCLGIWGDWSCLGKNDHYFLIVPLSIKRNTNPNKTRLYQYAIEHKMDPEKFSIITEAEKNRWDGGYFRENLERDIQFYRGGIERKKDTKKYHKFLTDRDRLVGEELLCHDLMIL